MSKPKLHGARPVWVVVPGSKHGHWVARHNLILLMGLADSSTDPLIKRLSSGWVLRKSLADKGLD